MSEMFLQSSCEDPDQPAIHIVTSSPYYKSCEFEGTTSCDHLTAKKIITKQIHSHKHSNGKIQRISSIDFRPKFQDLDGSTFVVDSSFTQTITIRLPLVRQSAPVRFEVLVQNSKIKFLTNSKLFSQFDKSSYVISPSRVMFLNEQSSVLCGTGKFVVQTSILPSQSTSLQSNVLWKIEGNITREYNL